MGCLLLISACNDSDYELEKLVPEKYHKILYINNSGKQELTLFDTEEDTEYTLSAFKGGSEPNQLAGATIRVLSQTELNESYSIPEGVNYKVVNRECYVLETDKLEFSVTDRYKTVGISLKPQQVKAAIESDPEALWVLPLRMVSETDSVNAEKKDMILYLKEVIMPALGFVDTSVDVKNYNYGEVPAISEKITIALDMDNKWDLSWEIDTDNNYVATYNQKNNTSFKTLPEGSYTLPESMQLGMGTSTAQLTVTVKGDQLEPGDYMLPILLKNISLFEISSEKNLYPLAIRIVGNKLDRTAWTAEANTQEPNGEGAGNGVAKCVLDDKPSTFWHSQWQGGTHALPHEVILDAKEEYTFTQIALMQRQHDSNRDTRSGEFYISSDKQNWTKVGDFTMEKILEAQMYSVTPVKGRYIMIKILESYRSPHCSLSEVYVYGLK